MTKHRLFDHRVRGEEPRAERVHHVVRVALGRRHERLDPAELQPLLVVQDGAEQRVATLAAQRPLHGLRIGRVECGETLLDRADVHGERREEIVHQRGEVRGCP